MLVFVLCLVHNVDCVSVLYISDCNAELNEDKYPFFITITYRQYRDTGNVVYKTQNEDKYPFFTTITYRQYRDTGNIVYKTQNEDKYPFFTTITDRQYRDTGNLYCI
jgi:hypothetical protein